MFTFALYYHYLVCILFRMPFLIHNVFVTIIIILFFAICSAEEDAYDVLHEVNQLAWRWSCMCRALRLRSHENIRAEHKNPNDCLGAVIDKWLQKNYDYEKFGSPTWKMLVKAVADPFGGDNTALAESIAKNHLSKYLFCTVLSASLTGAVNVALDFASQAVQPLQLVKL